MTINLHAQRLQFLLIGNRTGLIRKMCQADTSDIKAVPAECVNQTENIHVVGDAEIRTDLVFLNVLCRNNNDNFRLVLKLRQHLDFTVRFESRKNARCMIIVKKLAAEFEIELAAECTNPLLNSLRLHFQIFVIVKTCFIHFCPLHLLFFLFANHFYYTGKRRQNQYKKTLTQKRPFMHNPIQKLIRFRCREYNLPHHLR